MTIGSSSDCLVVQEQRARPSWRVRREPDPTSFDEHGAGYQPGVDLVHTDMLRFFTDLVNELGGDPQALMLGVGIDPSALATGKASAGSGLTASKLGTITRSGGKHQVTYNGHPLYLYVGDKKPGDVTGQGVTAFGAAWFVLSPAGNEISAAPPSSGGGTSSSLGY